MANSMSSDTFQRREVPAHTGILLSIHMTSNRPDQFVWFLDQLEATTRDKTCVEVVIKIDDDDEAMNELLRREVARRPFRIRFISTPLVGGFFGLWRSYDELLRLADPEAYFVVGLNDEMFFAQSNWDDALRRYVGLFSDHIFRLRTSEFRYRNYYDFWEVGWANDTSSFMTKRWLEIGGGWCPCNGPDTFQQYVAYYFGWLLRFDRARPQREIPISDISFRGHGASLTISGEALRRRQGASIKPWFILLSHKMQQEAARRARLLYGYVWASERGLNPFQVRDNASRKVVEVLNANQNIVLSSSYSLSRIRISAINAFRIFNWAYYGGAGDDWKNKPWANTKLFLCLRYPALDQFSARIAVMHTTVGRTVRQNLSAIGLAGLNSSYSQVKEYIRCARRDLRQVYRECLEPLPANRRLRYRVTWAVFRTMRQVASSRNGEQVKKSHSPSSYHESN
jgi:hypothetical protein